MNADIARLAVPPADPTRHVTPTRHFTLCLSATFRGARLARHLAAEQLHRWGWPYDTEANHTSTLLVAELATNAVRHGHVRGRDFRLRLTLYPEDPALRIEVTDARPDRR
ncbi:ATP-binding protein, partial [Streptomyces sp. MB09-02B]|uniref:ATP-binding protein n=1 Tax=Streptomyces sp. MB09-02B TaxID=3028667 RepID=UPI0029A3287C